MKIILFLGTLWVAAATPVFAKLSIVATTPDLAAIAEAVGGKQVEVESLARPAEDPHFVDPKPSLILKLRKADVLIEGGADLEAGWLSPLVDRAGNRKIQAGGPGRIRANQGVRMLEVPTVADRSAGDIHAAGNPHFLVDPANALIVARNITEVFAKMDPKQADQYETGFKRFAAQLEAKLAEWEKALEPYKGQTLVGYHNAWPYFAERFGLKIDLFLEPKPGIPPTPTHLAEVISEMKARRAKIIIVDAYVDRRTAEMVAGRTGASVIDVTHFPGGVKGTEAGYIALMDYLVNSISKGMGGAQPGR